MKLIAVQIASSRMGSASASTPAEPLPVTTLQDRAEMAKAIKARAKRKHNPLVVSASSEYSIWSGIKRRCYNEQEPSFSRYGGRGITMSDEWRSSFDVFIRDMGHRPTDQHSIDRIDNSKGYCKENCRWATKREQQNNTRANKTITHDGRTLTIAEWARVTGIYVKTITYRLKMQWPPEECLRVKDNRAGRTTRYIGVAFGKSAKSQ